MTEPEQPDQPEHQGVPAPAEPPPAVVPPSVPPPPIGPPPVAGAAPPPEPFPLTPYATASESTATVSHRGSHRGLIAVAAVVLVAGAGFALMSLGSGGGGAESPEAAVESLFGSLDQEDIIGMAESLRPAEREVLQGPIEEAVTELERLDLLADVDLRGLQGIDIEVEGYQLATTTLADGIVRVDVSGGTVTGSASPDQLPLGQTMRDILEEDLGVEIPVETESETDDMGEFALVAIEDDGGWYVSPGYSIAEAARGDEPLPPFGTVAPVGGSTPEEAVQGLLDAATNLDARAAIGALDPEEMGALYDYAPLFLDDADQGAAEIKAEDGFEASVDDLEMHSEDGPGNTQRVIIDGFHMTAAGEGESLDLTLDGDCFTFEATSTYESYSYDDEFDEEFSETETDTESGSWCRDTGLQIDDTEEDEEYDDEYSSFGFPETDFGFPQIALLTVQRDGVWYVTPTRSILDLGVTALRGVETGDIEKFREWFREFWGPIDFEYDGEQFEAVGEAVGGECDALFPDDPDAAEDDWTAYDECMAELFGEVDDSDEEYVDPFEECWDASNEVYDTGAGSSDRLAYLAELAYERCQQEVIERGDADKDDFSPSYVHDEECYEPYEGLDPDAAEQQWSAADDEVAACFEESFDDFDEDLTDEDADNEVFDTVPTTDSTTDTTGQTMPDFDEEELDGALGCMTDNLDLSTDSVGSMETEAERTEALEALSCMLEFVPESEQCSAEFEALDATLPADAWADAYLTFDGCMTAVTE